jgi:hypothetical protein
MAPQCGSWSSIGVARLARCGSPRKAAQEAAPAPRRLLFDLLSHVVGRLEASSASLDLVSGSHSAGTRRSMTYTRRIRPSFVVVPHLGDGTSS